MFFSFLRKRIEFEFDTFHSTYGDCAEVALQLLIKIYLRNLYEREAIID